MATLIYDADGLGILSVISFDVVLAENHADSAEVTKHPIETGSQISDHVTPGLTKVLLEAYVTNTPIHDGSDVLVAGLQIGSLRGVQAPVALKRVINKWLNGAQVNGGGVWPLQVNGMKRPQNPITTTAAVRLPVTEFVGGNSLQFPVYVDRVTDIYSALKKLARGGTEVTYSSDRGGYASMHITSLSAPRLAEDGIAFSLTLEAVEYVSSKFVQVTKKVPEEKRAKPVAEVGEQAPLPDLFEEEDETQSTVWREGAQGGANWWTK